MFYGHKKLSLQTKSGFAMMALPFVKKVNFKTMSTFAIYAFVITGLYIAYMAVAIIMDLFGKKGQLKDSTEVINNDDMVRDSDEERSTIVDETDDGYAVHHSGDVLPSPSPSPSDEEKATTEKPVSSDEEEPSPLEQPVDPNSDDDALLEQESLDSVAEYERAKSVQLQMGAVQPGYQEEYRSEDFAVVMALPINKRSRILKRITSI